MAFTTVTLTGTFRDRADGTAARGYVSFQLSAALINGSTIAPAFKEKIHLTDGAFSVTLPATNDTGTTPTGATYSVVEHIEGALENTYSIELVYTDATQDLADIAEVENTDLAYYATQAEFDAHLADTSDAHDASAISVADSATQYTATNVEDALAEVLDAHQAHLADTSDAHDASAISLVDSANDFTATEVEGALAELQADHEADATSLSDHIADTADAHDASAISVADAGGLITATDVEGALAELAAGGAGSVGDVLDMQFVRKTADESVTSSTTLQNDDHLAIAIGANEVWVFRAFLRFYGNASNTPDIKVAFTVPASAVVSYGGVGPATTVTASVGDGEFDAGTVSADPISYGTGTGSNVVVLEGIVVNGTNAGNLQLQWAQNTSDANTVTVFTNSYLLATRVA